KLASRPPVLAPGWLYQSYFRRHSTAGLRPPGLWSKLRGILRMHFREQLSLWNSSPVRAVPSLDSSAGHPHLTTHESRVPPACATLPDATVRSSPPAPVTEYRCAGGECTPRHASESRKCPCRASWPCA